MQQPQPDRGAADLRSQSIFDMAARQAARMLTSDSAAAAIAADAKARGPAQAIVAALEPAMQVMQKAAGGSGVEVPPDVLQAVWLALAQLLATMMAASGLAKDAQSLMAEVEAMRSQAPQQPARPQQDQQPQQGGMLAAARSA